MSSSIMFSKEFWSSLKITPQDVENLHNVLFERETPLSTHDLCAEFINERVKTERESLEKKHSADGKTYLPRNRYQVGDEVVFPAMEWKQGKVKSVREGVNPGMDAFEVLTVQMEDHSERMFAANLQDHFLNDAPTTRPEFEMLDSSVILAQYGPIVESKLEAAFQEDEGLVRMGGRWFPRALLVDIGQGQLNLAEAVLDMSGGEPLSTEALIKDIELPGGINPRLAEFSVNYALQNDDRFDEVGPAGKILWCLRRLEPDQVRDIPAPLRYFPVEHDRNNLTPAMLNLEAQLDDELTPVYGQEAREEPSSVTIALIYPHLRAGTLPMSARARKLFPTALETERVRFTLVDGRTKQRIPAWAVLTHGYIFGLREWYKSHQLIPGSLVQIRRGEKPDEVIVEVKRQQSSKDWVRTVLVGKDGGFVFATLKQPISAEFNDRMVIHVPDFKSLDPVWEKRQSFEDLVMQVLRELSKSNPQGHVHAQELYAAVNLVRRMPPAPIFALLAESKACKHVGDLHFRLAEDLE